MGFIRPSELSIGSRNGGDDSVKRDDAGRPVLLSPCWLCGGTGRREGKTPKGVKCQGCNGEGTREKRYKRVTTFIDVLDDKSNLMAWTERKVLIGAAMDSGLVKDVLTFDDTTTDGRNEINRRAKIAKNIAGASEKADKGTHLHGLSEIIDRDEPLPSGLDPQDYVDMKAYANGTTNFDIRHMEELVVHEALGVAGTPDRVSRVYDNMVAPDGSIITPGELLITDLKTGRTDFGQLKMAMQLAIYSRSELNVEGSTERKPMENVNQKWGLIMHLPAGSGELTLYWADLEMGWEAVEVAQKVHELRRRGKAALIAA